MTQNHSYVNMVLPLEISKVHAVVFRFSKVSQNYVCFFKAYSSPLLSPSTINGLPASDKSVPSPSSRQARLSKFHLKSSPSAGLKEFSVRKGRIYFCLPLNLNLLTSLLVAEKFLRATFLRHFPKRSSCQVSDHVRAKGV